MKSFRTLLILAVLMTSHFAAAAPKRIANCESQNSNERICVHVNDYGNKKKVILKQCGNMNSWETYTVNQNGDLLSGFDSKKRTIELKLGASPEIIYAKAINLNKPEGFEEILNMPLTCTVVED